MIASVGQTVPADTFAATLPMSAALRLLRPEVAASLPPRLGRQSRHPAICATQPTCDVQHAFCHYVSPSVVERLMADPRLLDLGGETRDITVLFADIRGFSTLAETLQDDPQRLVRLVNAVLNPLSEIVVSHGGTIDKYTGDGLMAFWGAPLDDADHPDRAVDGARAMLDAMWAINAALQRLCDGQAPSVAIGIGVNSGACVVGNMGSAQRFDYSAIGDPVNVASRLEGLSKVYGAPLMIGEATARRLQRNVATEIDRVTVRGRNGAQGVFTVS